MGCGQGLAKTLLIVANVVFVLVGIAFVTIGIIGRMNIDKVSDGIPSNVNTIGVFNFVIAVGAIVILIASLGCCGSCNNNICMLNSYGVILVVLFLVQMGLGIYALIQIKDKTELSNVITTQVEKLVKNYSSTNNGMDAIQQALQCCGSKGPSDYTTQSVPTSCYDNLDTSGDPYPDGCSDKITTLLESTSRILAIVVMTMAGLEVVGAVIAFGLTGCIRSKRATGY